MKNPSPTDLANGKWAVVPCTRVEALPGLKGLGEGEIESLFGRAQAQSSFLLGERLDEFHIVLQNTYPLSKPKNRELPVREWTWSKGDCKLTVWFHEVNKTWSVFENSRYPASAEF